MTRFIPKRKPSYSTYPLELLYTRKDPVWPDNLEFDSLPPSYDESLAWEKNHPGEVFVPPPGGWEAKNQTSRRRDDTYYYQRGRSLQVPEVVEENNEENEIEELDEKKYYAHKDRKELYDIIHAAFLK